jgi:uncharacterized protein (TIGR02328 family)
MRLWHEALIPLLPRQQLLGQHRECCALRGLGWGKPQSTVNYVFKHPYAWLVVYHKKVMNEMEERGYTVDFRWYDANYRGKTAGYDHVLEVTDSPSWLWSAVYEKDTLGLLYKTTVYPEHNEKYLNECLENLARKGIVINKEDIQ